MGLVLLVRHGQALPQPDTGHGHGHGQDMGLSASGKRQAALLGEALLRRGVSPEVVISGGLARQRETAELCLAAMGSATARALVDERWREYDVQSIMAAYPPAGPVAGPVNDPAADPRGFQRRLDGSLSAWMADGEPAPGILAWSAFAAAAPAALRELAAPPVTASGYPDATPPQPGRAILVFTSAGPITAVAADLLGLGPDAFLALHRVVVNSSLTKVIAGSRGCHLLTFNDHSHLERAGERLLTYR